MYAYQLFDKILAEVNKAYAEMGNDIIGNAGKNLFYKMRDEGFSPNDSWRAVAGGFACVACNDGRISYDELRAYNAMHDEKQADYSTFFDIMSKYNKQEHRNYTIELFNRMSNPQTAYNFVMFCIAVCVVDGSVAPREESFCTSLCEVFLNRFNY